MPKNLVALLIAAALVLLSAMEITYMSIKSPDPTTRIVLPPGESKTKKLRSRAAVSVQGLPAQIILGSLPGRMVESMTRMQPE